MILLIYNLSDLALLAQITPNFSLGLAGLKKLILFVLQVSTVSMSRQLIYGFLTLSFTISEEKHLLLAVSRQFAVQCLPFCH